MIIPGMHIFTFCEDYGPFMCELDDCHRPAWSVVMTDDEFAELPENVGGNDLATHIIMKHVGKRACKTCIKQMARS